MTCTHFLYPWWGWANPCSVVWSRVSLPVQSDLPSVSSVSSLRFQFDSPLVRLQGSCPRLRRASSTEVPFPTDKDSLPDLLAVSPSPETGRFSVVLAVLLETLGQVVKMILALFSFRVSLPFFVFVKKSSSKLNRSSSSTSPSLLFAIPASVSMTSLSACWARDSCYSWTHVRAWALVVTRATSVTPPPVVTGSRVCSSVSHFLSFGTSWPTNMSTGRCGETPTVKWYFFPANSRVTLAAGNQVFRELAVA